jgi:radical SAM-linked protein
VGDGESPGGRPNTLAASSPLSVDQKPPMTLDKFRIRFRKSGDLRLLSHHDLMRTFERMLRRAQIPYRTTGGFHPKPRFVFPLSLPLGVVGLLEVLELEVTEVLDPSAVLNRLSAQAPAGLVLLSIRRIPVNLTGRPVRTTYRFPVPADQTSVLVERCSALLALPECWVERRHPQPRRADIRPYIRDLRIDANSLEIEIQATPTGSARADEVVDQLGLADALEAGSILERTNLELLDEMPPDAESDASVPPNFGAEVAWAESLPDC